MEEEEEEVRRRSAPRPWPTGGWLMNYHIYSSAGSVSLQRGPWEPPCSTSHNHTSGSSAEPWTTLLSAPRAEAGGVHDSVVTLEKDDICPWQWHPPPGTKPMAQKISGGQDATALSLAGGSNTGHLIKPHEPDRPQ
jgi:hypothetical protein